MTEPEPFDQRLSDREAAERETGDLRRAVLEELLAEAAACRTCGKVHGERQIGERQWTWEDPQDGHPYRPAAPWQVTDWLAARTGSSTEPDAT